MHSDEFFKVSHCASAKEMWDILEVTHEGTTIVHKDGQDSSECSDGETLSFLIRKFGKFLKKNNWDKNQPSNRYNSKKVNEFNSTNYTCFGCDKQGHIKAYCPNSESKEKEAIKKFEKKGKARKV